MATPPQRTSRLPNMHGGLIRIPPGVANVIVREAPASLDGRETGGILLGHDLGDQIQVTVAGGPGPNADRRADGFLRDLEYSRQLADRAYETDASVWIGEWHTHPTGPTNPSPRDIKTYLELFANQDLNFKRIVSLIVVPCSTHGWTETIVIPWLVTPEDATSQTILVFNDMPSAQKEHDL